MAVRWADVESKPEFQSLSDADKALAQNQFFDENLSGQIPEEDRPQARQQFLGEFGRSTVDTGQSRFSSGAARLGRSALSVVPQTIGGIGEISEGFVRNLNPVGWAANLGVPGAQPLVDLYSQPGQLLREYGDDPLQRGIEGITPINPLYAQAPEQKALDVLGQAGGQMASMVIPAKALTLTPKVATALGLTQAAAMGAESGGKEADIYGITDPAQRSLMALLYGGAEAGSESLTGFGTPNVTRQILGDMRSFLTGKGAGSRFLKTALGEGAEEVPAGVAQDTIASVMAPEDPNRPGYSVTGVELPDPLDWRARAEEFGYGTLAGGLFGAGQLVGSRATIDEAFQYRKRAQDQIQAMEGKELSTEEQQDLDRLKEEDRNISQWLTLQGARQSIPILNEIAPDDPVVRDFTDLVQAADSVQDSDMELAEKERLLRSFTQEILAHPANQINPLSESRQGEILTPRNPAEEVKMEVADNAAANDAPLTAQALQSTPTPPTHATPEITQQISVSEEREGGDQIREASEASGGRGILGETAGLTEEVDATPTLAPQQQEVAQPSPSPAQATQGQAPVPAPQLRRRLPGQMNTEPISREDVEVAIQSYLAQHPERQRFTENTWIGPASELANMPEIRQAYLNRLGQSTGTALTEEQGEKAWQDWLQFGQTEAFVHNGRSYIITDRIVMNKDDIARAVEMSKAGVFLTPEQWAARRVLAHEDRHILTDYIANNPEFSGRFRALADQITPEQLDDLARRRYGEFSDWKNNQTQRTFLEFEWFSEQAERENPENPSLIQQFLELLRDIYSRIMGVPSNSVSEAELREFLKKASLRQAEQAGNATGALQFSNPEVYQPTKVERAEFEESTKDLPQPMRNFAQVLGQRSNTEYLVQQVQPMVDFARAKMNAGLPEFFEEGEKADYSNTDRPPVNEENTKNAFRLATALLDRRNPYAPEYNEEIRRATGRQYDAASEVLKLELMDYAVRLASTYKPGEEYKLELPLMLVDMANDTVTGLYATVAGAGRLLNVRGRAQKGGFWDAMKLIREARDEAAASKIGGPKLKALTDSLTSEDADVALIQGLNDSTAYQSVKELVDAAESRLQAEAQQEQDDSDWWERGMEAVGEWERTILKRIQDKLQRIVAIKDLLAQLPPEVSEPFQASLPAGLESIKTDRNALLRELEALEKGLIEDLRAIEKAETKLSKEQRKKVAKKVRAAMTPTEEAESILKRYEDKPKAAKKSPSKLKQAFLDQVKNPVSVEEFVAKVQELGVDETTAAKMFETAAKVKARRDDAKIKRKTDPERISNSSRFVNELVEKILNAPPSLQGNKAWRRQTLIDAFLSRGLNQKQAEAAADALDTVLSQQWKKAKVQAAQKAAKRLNLSGLPMEAVIKAINSEAFSSTDPITKALAEQAGFKEVPKDKIARMAWLAEQIQNPSTSPTESALWRAELEDIIQSLKMPKGMREIVTRSFENSALSGTSNIMINYTSVPFTLARRLGVDLLDIAVSGGTTLQKLNQMGNAVLSMKDVITKRFAQEVKNSWKNDAYSRRLNEHIAKSYSLKQEIRKNLDILNDPNKGAGEKAKAVGKLIYSSTDLIRRILSVADQAWGASMDQYFFRTQATREMLKGLGMTPKEGRAVTEMAMETSQRRTDKRVKELADQGTTLSPTTISLIQQDYYNQAIREYLDAKRDGLGTKTAETADQEAAAEIGAVQAEIPAIWDIPQHLFELTKYGSQAILKKSPLIGRMMTGFVSVPANIVNRSLYFTPLGLARVASKKYSKNRGEIYNELMRNSQGERLRLMEGIIGTIGMAFGAALNSDDDDKDQFGIGITGQGPRNPSLREAWLKDHKQNAIEITVDGNRLSIPYGRGGFEGVSIPMAAAGAVDDLRLNKTNRKDANLALRWAGQTWSAFTEQARFLGIKNFAESLTQPSPATAAKSVAFTTSGFIPFSGFLKSIGRIASGQADQSSVESALLANYPVANVFSNRKLNFLGDPTGKDDYVSRMWYSGLPIGIDQPADTPNSDIYKLLIQKGHAPAFPSRTYIEGKNGVLTDDQWARYVRTRGANIKAGIRQNMTELRNASSRDFDVLLDRITSESTRATKEQLGLD